MSLSSFLKKNSTTVLSVAASLGVGVTAFLSGRAAISAHNKLTSKSKNDDLSDISTKDKIQMTWKDMVIPVASGTATIGLIFLANRSGIRSQAALASLAASFVGYQKKVVELYGQEAHEYVIRELKADKAINPDICFESFLEFEHDQVDTTETLHTFYEPISEKLFEATLAQVLIAWIHLNRNFALRGEASVVEYWEFLGISDLLSADDVSAIASRYNVDSVNQLKWDVQDEVYFIDFSRPKKVFAGDVEVIELQPSWYPDVYLN